MINGTDIGCGVSDDKNHSINRNLNIMKTKILTLALFLLLFANVAKAQDKTTVNAYSADISDNLDLRAVASVFGDSEDLADFERRLNDPKLQITNLDLNGDNMVDYLRVIESVEGNTHLIIIQSVLGRDLFQDVATVEVERDSRNHVQIQVVGDVYMYGHNYIYEPVYVHRPIIYNTFWVRHYRPYFSTWYWGYYPSYYYAWNPFPAHIYQNHVHVHINTYHNYNYVNVRRSQRAVALHNTRRANAYEAQNPHRSFAQRTNATNRSVLVASREASNGVRNAASSGRSQATPQNNSTTRTQSASRSNSATMPTTRSATNRATSPATSARVSNASRTTTTAAATRTPNSTPSTRSTAVTPRSSVPAQTVRSNAATGYRSSTPATSTRSQNLSMNRTSTSPSVNRSSAPSMSRPAATPNMGSRSTTQGARTTAPSAGRR